MRAALLASHGYVTLALAYFNHADLPKDLTVDLDYFVEALDYLQKLPCVSKDGVGILGRCYGGAVALHLAVICPKVKAVVNMNGGCYLQESKLVTLKGQPVYHHSDFSRIAYSDEGFIFKYAYPASDEHCVPVERSAGDCQFLLIYGEDDQMTEASHGQVIQARLDRWERSRSLRQTGQWQGEILKPDSEGRGSKRCKLIVYPQTGHMMEPPYTPPFRSTWNKYFQTAFLWGGRQTPQAHTQEAAWREILSFFGSHLHQPTSKL